METNVVVVVFTLSECPACAAYMPAFQRIAARYQQVIPIAVYDVGTEDQDIQDLADRWGVEATPTTVVARRGPGFIKREGALAEAEIEALMETAYRTQMGML